MQLCKRKERILRGLVFDSVDSVLVMWPIKEFGVKSIGHFHLPNTCDCLYSV